MNRAIALISVALLPISACLADDLPPPPPQGVFIGKGQFGFLDSRGNSEARSVNANIDIMRFDGAWKNELYLGALYGKSAGIVSAERWEFRGQSDYNFTDRMFTFGALRFEHDEFDGFVYQGSITAGIGYKLLDNDATKLSAQVGAGYRRLRPEIITKDESGAVISREPQDAMGNAIGTVGVDFLHNFNKSTQLTNKFLVEAGSDDTLIHDTIALAVKMSEKLALSVGYGIIDNTKPPPGTKKLDTVATINLVFAF